METDTYTRKMSHRDEGRDHNDASISQGTTRLPTERQMICARDQSISHFLQKDPTLLTF